ncbi:MAG TPA: proline--tRNA ligase [Actinomycetota bacterium]|nr:proline--tRNA ligase [Actinomycetota bacterium]
MRLSALFAPTLREDPAEAEVPSHRLLLRAGFIRQVAAGVYTTLPIGLRSIRKIEKVVREEMDASGAQEFRMPIVLPSEPWKTTGRWELYGDLMFRLTDRHGREMLLGPTQEEIVTPLVDAELPSYRDLPVNLYQIEWKYRDEFRPRFGLLRGREFLMKDAYTFDRDMEGMGRSYQTMYDAYIRVFDRLGLDYVVVEAEPGQIGGGVNHEYMARAEVGEDRFVECENGDYLADRKAATPLPPAPVPQGTAPIEIVDTPNASTIEAVASLLGRPADRMLKSMFYDAGGQTLAVLVPGDREVEEAKLERAFFPTSVRRFEDADFAARGLVKGFVGPQGMGEDVVILADPSVRGGADWVAGANEPDRHATGVNTPRDFRIDRFEDVVALRDGDRCPNDGGSLSVGRAIVLGHIYQLGTNYSGPLGARFIDEDDSERPYLMGSYGIGISRILAAAVEQFHDDGGLQLPKALAPFDAVVLIANRDDDAVGEQAERIYGELRDRGVEAAIDDREETAGVKFADADLIGYPVQVVVGKRGVAAGTVDLKLRATGERSQASLAEAARAAVDLLAAAP